MRCLYCSQIAQEDICDSCLTKFNVKIIKTTTKPLVNLGRIHREKNLTQQELAKLINVNPSCIGYWKRGRSKIKKENLVKLLKVLDCSVEDLISDQV